MECSICGIEVQPTHKYCMECGARLQPTGERTGEAGSDAADGADATDAADTAADADADATVVADRVRRAGGGDSTPSTALRGHPMFDPVTGQLLAVRRDDRDVDANDDRYDGDTDGSDDGDDGDTDGSDDGDTDGSDRSDGSDGSDRSDHTGGSGEGDGAATDDADTAADADPEATEVLPVTPAATATPAAGSDAYPPWPGAAPAPSPPFDPPPGGRATDGYVAEPFAEGGFGAAPAAPAAPAAYEPTSRMPVPYVAWEGEMAEQDVAVSRRGFRLKPLLVLAVLAAAALGVGLLATMVELTGAADPSQNGAYVVNDFGTNLAVAGVLGALFMVFGAVAWCVGFRWGAGLAGGSGAGLFGWAVLPLSASELHRGQFTADLSLELGFWGVAGAGALGLLILFVSLTHAGPDGRAGLDPWVAALGAIAAVIATVGPLVPINNASVELNWLSPVGFDYPTVWFLARFAQLGLLLVCGVFGFLLVRRYGLGLAIGGAIPAGWLTLTAATEQTDRPIGPAFFNPGANLAVADDLVHVVTVAGMAMLMFFAIVATAMAVIDTK